MSLVVVATTEQTPFENGMTDDRRRQPRVSGAVGQDTDDEGAAGNDGRQQLQPHESQLATFAHIPSAEAEGHCAHYICPITVSCASPSTASGTISCVELHRICGTLFLHVVAGTTND